MLRGPRKRAIWTAYGLPTAHLQRAGTTIVSEGDGDFFLNNAGVMSGRPRHGKKKSAGDWDTHNQEKPEMPLASSLTGFVSLVSQVQCIARWNREHPVLQGR